MQLLDLVLKPLGISDFNADNRGPMPAAGSRPPTMPACCAISIPTLACSATTRSRHLATPEASHSIGTHSTGAGTDTSTWHGGYWIWNGVSFGGYHQYWHDVRTSYFVRVAQGSARTMDRCRPGCAEIATDPSIRDFDFTPFAERLHEARRYGS